MKLIIQPVLNKFQVLDTDDERVVRTLDSREDAERFREELQPTKKSSNR